MNIIQFIAMTIMGAIILFSGLKTVLCALGLIICGTVFVCVGIYTDEKNGFPHLKDDDKERED